MNEHAGSAKDRREIARLRTRLAEVEETLSAIRTGEVDAIAVDGPRGRQIFTLEDANQPYRILAEQMSEGTASMSEDGTILFCNNRLATMVRRRPQRLVGSPIVGLVSHSDAEAFCALFATASRRERRCELSFQRSDGTQIPVLASIKTLSPGAGHKFCLVATDLSDIKRAEADKARMRSRLDETSRLMNAIVEHSSDLITVCHTDGALEYVSPVCRSFLGQNSEDLTGKSVTEIVHPEDIAALLDFVSQPEGDQRPLTTLRCLREDGSTAWVETSKTMLGVPASETARVVLTFHDVTENRTHQQQIQAALHEKEVLLREVYHRVKNNLQVIQSLVKMQARTLQDEGTQQALEQMVQRVHAMALVHERLYQKQDLAGISLAGYLRDLFSGIMASHSLVSHQIHLTLDAEEILLTLENAVPFGLLMNELICNSLKHGFRGGRNGTISISVHRSGNSTHIVVQDNGTGLPEGFRAAGCSTMGLQLANSLAQQLGGKLHFSSDNGCRVETDLTRL